MSYEFLFTETKDIINLNMNNWLKDESDNFIDIKNGGLIDLDSKKRYLIISKNLNDYYKVFIGQIYYYKIRYIQYNIKLSDDIYMKNYLTANYDNINNKIIGDLKITKKGIIVLNPDEDYSIYLIKN
jgi:hypothetical protein